MRRAAAPSNLGTAPTDGRASGRPSSRTPCVAPPGGTSPPPASRPFPLSCIRCLKPHLQHHSPLLFAIIIGIVPVQAAAHQRRKRRLREKYGAWQGRGVGVTDAGGRLLRETGACGFTPAPAAAFEPVSLGSQGTKAAPVPQRDGALHPAAHGPRLTPSSGPAFPHVNFPPAPPFLAAPAGRVGRGARARVGRRKIGGPAASGRARRAAPGGRLRRWPLAPIQGAHRQRSRPRERRGRRQAPAAAVRGAPDPLTFLVFLSVACGALCEAWPLITAFAPAGPAVVAAAAARRGCEHGEGFWGGGRGGRTVPRGLPGTHRRQGSGGSSNGLCRCTGQHDKIWLFVGWRDACIYVPARQRTAAKHGTTAALAIASGGRCWDWRRSRASASRRMAVLRAMQLFQCCGGPHRSDTVRGRSCRTCFLLFRESSVQGRTLGVREEATRHGTYGGLHHAPRASKHPLPQG
jgi:hypothetical protein